MIMSYFLYHQVILKVDACHTYLIFVIFCYIHLILTIRCHLCCTNLTIDHGSTTTTPLQFMQSGNSPNLRRKILKASKRICKKPEPIAVLIHAISNGCGKLAGKSVLSPPCNLLVPQQLRREEWTQRIKKGV